MSIDANEGAKRLVDNVYITILARFAAVFGVPIAMTAMVYMAGQFVAMKDTLTRIDTALIVGIGPRLTAVEADIVRINKLVTDDRYTRADARELEQRIQTQINRLEQALRDLRAANRP